MHHANPILLAFIVIFVIPVHTLMQLMSFSSFSKKVKCLRPFMYTSLLSQNGSILSFWSFTIFFRWTILRFGISVGLRKMTILSCTVSSTKERIFCNYHIGFIRLNYNFLKLMLKMITCITAQYECISTL